MAGGGATPAAAEVDASPTWPHSHSATVAS